MTSLSYEIGKYLQPLL